MCNIIYNIIYTWPGPVKKAGWGEVELGGEGTEGEDGVAGEPREEEGP